jgi:hypothetical protein
VIQPRKPTTGYISVTRSSTLAVIDVLSSVRSQLQRVLGGSRDDSSPVRGTLLGALAASGDLKGSLPADFADSLALPRRSRKVDGNDGLAAVAEDERFGTSRQQAQGGCPARRRGHLRRRLGRPERDEVSHKSRYCRHAPDQERCWSQPNAGRRFGVRGVYHNVTTTPRLSTAFLGGWWRALAPERH